MLWYGPKNLFHICFNFEMSIYQHARLCSGARGACGASSRWALVSGFGFWDSGLAFRVKGLGYRVQGLGLCLGLRISAVGLRVRGFWVGVECLVSSV